MVLPHAEHCICPELISRLYKKEGETSSRSFSNNSAGEAAMLFLDFLLCIILLQLLQRNAAATPSRMKQPIIKEVHFTAVLLSTFIGLKSRSGMADGWDLGFGFCIELLILDCKQSNTKLILQFGI
jgi:hypothetical protein